MRGKTSAALRSFDFEEILDLAPVMRGSDLAARRAHPTTGEVIEPPAELAKLLPDNIPLGGVAVIKGDSGWGASTLCYRILAAANAAGVYAALFDPAGNAMPAALIEAGVWPDRFVLVRATRSGLPKEKLLRGLGALLDGFHLVGILDPQLLGSVPWARIAARARERGVLVVLAGDARSDVNALFRIDLSAPKWEKGSDGLLISRSVWASISGVGRPRSERVQIGCSEPAPPGYSV